MQTPIIWLAVLAVVLDALCSGCTMTRRLRPPIDPSELAEVTLEARDRNVEISLAVPSTSATSTPLVIVGTTSHKAFGSGLVLGLEKATWQDELGNQRSAPLAAVREVRHLSPGHPRLIGAFQGAGLGLIAGAVLGVITGLASGDDECDPRRHARLQTLISPPQLCILKFSAATKATWAGVAFGAAGLLAGGVIGAIVGEKTTVRLEHDRARTDSP